MEKYVENPPIDALNKIRIASEKSDLFWKRAKRSFFALMTIWGVIFYFFIVGTAQGWWESSKDPVIPVVRINGGITPGSDAGGADVVIVAIKAAFSMKNATGIVLYIDSPGGSPSEAERINRVIEDQKMETGKKVYAVCGNLCASAGYMIALHADEIFAGRYSLVGSIGAVMNSWNFSTAINKFGVQQRAYASGNLKAMLNPYTPVKPEDEVKAQALVAGMGKIFVSEVEQRRGKKLTKAVDLFTGEVWSGEDAKKYGLVDGIATLDDVLKVKFAKNAKVKELIKPHFEIPFMKAAVDILVNKLMTEMVERAPSIN